GRELVINMIRCRVPVVAAVNGPAVGLGCSVIALSDVVYMAESAYLSGPHVTGGVVGSAGWQPARTAHGSGCVTVCREDECHSDHASRSRVTYAVLSLSSSL